MGKSGSVLVIDDDPDIRDFMTQVLEDEGYTIFAAANGVDALAILRGRTSLPCLVLLDLAMPIMDGWEFRRNQMSDQGLQSIPVVVLTADNRVRQKAEELNANGFLEKPLSLTALLDMVERYCAAHGLGPE